MPIFKKPVVASPDGSIYLVMQDGELLSADVIPRVVSESNLLKVAPDGFYVVASDFVSATPDNALTVGLDGKLTVAAPVADPLSKQAGNYLRYGNDGQKVFLDGNDVLSNGVANLLRISPVDGKIELTRDDVGVQRSADEGNVIRIGSDGGLFLSGRDLVSVDDGNIIKTGSDGLLFATAVSDRAGNLIQSDDGHALLFGADLLSTDTGNLLVVGLDGRLVLSGEDIISLNSTNALYVDETGRLMVRVVSGDQGNLITQGSDGGAFLTGSFLLSEALGNKLTIGDDGKLNLQLVDLVDPDDLIIDYTSAGLNSTLMMTYDTVRGDLALVGKGNKIIDRVAIPSSVSMLEDVEIVKDPASQPLGTYMKFTFRLADNSTKVEWLDATTFIDIYKAGLGINLTDNNRTVNVNIDTASGLAFNALGQLTFTGAGAGGGKPSADPGNVLTTGSDGGIMLSLNAVNYNQGSGITVDNVTRTIAARLSLMAGNLLTVDNTGALFVDGSRINATISADNKNIIKAGSDGGVFSSGDYGTMD